MKPFNLLQIILLFLVSLLMTHLTLESNLNKFLKPIGYGFKNLKTSAQGELPNFALLDHKGKFQELYRNTDVENILIVATDINCSSFEDILKNLDNNQNTSLRIFLLSINNHDSRKNMLNISQKFQSDISILMDSSHIVTKELGFKNVGDFLLINKQEWKKTAIGNLLKDPNLLNNKLKLINNNLKINISNISCDLQIRKINEEIDFE